jgi:hypothetical protein
MPFTQVYGNATRCSEPETCSPSSFQGVALQGQSLEHFHFFHRPQTAGKCDRRMCLPHAADVI